MFFRHIFAILIVRKYCSNLSEPLDLCGLSLGAVLSLNYAIDNPEKISSLILIAPQYNMPKTLLKIQNIIFHFMPNSAFSKIGLTKKGFIEFTNSMMNIDFSENIKNLTYGQLLSILLNIFHNNLYFKLLWN